MNKVKTLGALIAVLVSAPSMAGYTIDIADDHKLTLGGYFKADLRHVNGDLAYRDFWVGNNGVKEDTSETRFNIRESRFNIQYQYSDIKAVLEWDFYDDQQPTGTTETVTGGHSLRLRHAYVQSGNWKVGQTWSTFMPLVSIAEALDFGGAHVGQSFVRQTQVRYTNNGLELALENPSTQSGISQSVPDVIARYTYKGDWGQMAVAGLARTLDNGGDETKADGTQFSYNVHGRIKTFGKDDFRFSYNGGRPGRYVSPGANIHDSAIDGDIYDVQAITVAYRHFWTEDLRSNLYYGSIKIDDQIGADGKSTDRRHIGLNLLKNINPKTTLGIEIGNYETETADSDYLMVSAKYVL
ncbi:DcaP family trimeric outer membrane transporter [Thalassotalea sp. PLHSN55]|uniref:DcaP family trimeric outer membrane transporter n=1 Tax=Thalassotalea sp. PLHSN55 TaxID=3435888 RepID=UPI003F8648D9